jgi:glycyl-tRNA synthetase (class II)
MWVNLRPNGAGPLSGGIEQSGHLRQFLFTIIDIGLSLAMFRGDHVVQPQNQQSVSQNGI